MNSVWKRYGIFSLFSVLLIIFDQWTKVLAYDKLRVNGPFVIWDGVFELLYSENRGAAFGILQGQKWFFLVVAAAVVIVILLFLYKMPDEKKMLPLFFCTILLASGAIGNVIDRLSRGFVVDFLYFKLINFPIFNVADCYVVVAAGLLILLTGFFYKDEDLDFLSSKEK